MGKIVLLDKINDLQLCYGLRLHEFNCKCNYIHCKHTIVNEDLVIAYERLRSAYNAPLTITSGYRCTHHNHDIGGSEKSYHTIGSAVDVVLSADMDPRDFEMIATWAGFSTCLYYPKKNFFHLDVRQNVGRKLSLRVIDGSLE